MSADFIDIGRVREALKNAGEEAQAYALNETGSTNADLLCQIKHGDLRLTVLTARRQTAGRGTRGRTWNDAGESLLFSLLMPCPDVRQASCVPLLAGCCAASVLQQLGFPVKVKWPNDLWLSGGKAGGILCELARTPDGCTGLVLGMGINLCAGKSGSAAYRAAQLREALSSGEAASLRTVLLSALLLVLIPALRECLSGKTVPDWSRWAELDAFRNCEVTFETGSGEAVSGVYRGMSASGAACIESSDGIHEYFSGTLRLLS